VNTGAPPTVGAVVVTHNRWSFLQRSLEGLKRQTVPLSDVIVVDNASEDGTREGTLRQFPWATYRLLTENLGGAGGFSEGIRFGYEKGYDWLWVMDDDAIPEPEALERMLETEVIRKPETGVLACLVFGVDGKLDQRSRAQWLDMRTFRSTPILVAGEEAVECNSAPFVGILVRRTAISQVGLPRSDFFIACDDVEYIHRICRAGFKAYQIPRSKIVHLNAGVKHGTTNFPRFSRNGHTATVWRSYYDWRNSMYLMHQYSSPVAFIRKAGRYAVAAILFGDRKLRRLHVLAQAMSDARAGRLGRKAFPPE
jgi:rhamnopyranosyl-N-acetylglucosaminyl-diphospho-decaprenol beta-1,3/1,4-galactofuranosyltransferase